MSILRSVGAFFFLLIVCVLAYWDIASFQDSLKWDMMDCYYPWRFFVGESIQNRVFPLWNPYQHMGYPIYADMRSVFYPEAFVVGLLGGYSLPVLHFLFVFYITAAGTGLYQLASWFIKNEIAKITVASAYVMCGFFVGHGQEMFGIIAATWIPWVLYYFMRFQKSLEWPDLWKLSFFLFLQLTGGYQALSLILFYLLITIFIVGYVRNHRSENGHSTLKMLTRNAVLTGLILVSLTVLIVTYIQVSPNVDRLTGLSLQDAYIGLLTPQALLSILAPFSVAGDADFLGTNISMANVYVGILVLGFAVAGLFLRKHWTAWVLMIFGIICLFASLGPHTPIREFMYNYVPGMNLFRMSSFFSYFSQMAFLILGAIALEKLLENPSGMYKKVASAFGMVLLALVVVAISTWIDRPEEAVWVFSGQFDLLSYTYHQRLIFHSLMQIGVVLLFLSAIFILRKHQVALSFTILLFVLAEMFTAVQFNFKSTVGGGFNPSEIQANLDQQPDGFPIPPQSIPIAANIEFKPDLSPLFHNTNIYSKTISQDGFNSFRLNRFEIFKRDHQLAYHEMLEQPLLFSTSTHTEIEILGFDPARTECSVVAEDSCLLVFQQVYFPGWNVLVDGKQQNQLLYNGIYPSAKIGKGGHSVVFVFDNNPVLVGFGISYLMFALIIGACLFFLIRSMGNSSSRKTSLFTIVIMIVGVAFFGFKWAKLEPMEDNRTKSYENLAIQIAQLGYSGTQIYLHVDLPAMMNQILNQHGLKNEVEYLYGLECDDHSRFIQTLKTNGAEHLIYAGSNVPEDRTVMELIKQLYPTKTSHRFGRDYVHVFERKGERKTIYSSTNNFEADNAVWHYTNDQKDSSAKAFSGQLGWRISPSQMGSPPIILRVGDLTDESRLTLVFQSKVLVEGGDRNDAGMFIQIEREGEKVWSRARNITSCSVQENQWFETVLVAEPDLGLLPDDVLKVFVWGSDIGGPIYLDDMSFSVYPQD